MWQRVLTALVAIPLVLGWLWVAEETGGFWLIVLMTTLINAAAAWEYAQLVHPTKIGRKLFFTFAATGIVLVNGVGLLLDRGGWGALFVLVFDLPLLLAAALILWVVNLLSSAPPSERFHAAGADTLGLLYIPGILQLFPLSFRLRMEEGKGFEWTLGLLLLVWAYDTGAFLAGRRWGRHKLAPRLSPGKTWEGVLGGALLAFAAAGLGLWLLWPDWPWIVRLGHAVGLSLSVSAAAQLGDLFESLLKRAAGVKDSGVLFPGHGGMLDRIDGLLFALPVYLGYLSILSATPS